MTKTDSYGLEPSFEVALAVLCASRPKFYGAVGKALEPTLLASEAAQLILKACRVIDKELGHGPSSPVVVAQRIRRWSAEGLLTKKQIDAVADILLEPHDDLPTEQEVSAEIVPILQQRVRRQAVTVALDDMSKRGDLSEAAKLIAKSNTIGKIDTSTGARLGSKLLDDIAAGRAIERLPLGIPELDATLKGGLRRGKQLIYIGGTGAGKSMALSHAAAGALCMGYSGAVATLEIDEVTWQARVMASMTSIPISDILAGDPAASKMVRKFLDQRKRTLGTLVVKDFPAKVTTMHDIEEWVKQAEEEEGTEFAFLVIDYGDKLTIPNRGQRGEYEVAGEVFERMRLYGAAKNKWILTASQAVRRAGTDKSRVVDVDDGADSQHKVRVADLVVTITPRGESKEELIYLVGKDRLDGTTGTKIGPLPHNFVCGQMVVP